MGGHGKTQMERFSRAFVIAAACAAEDDITFSIPPDDIEGVDMVVSQRGVTVDFQLKSTRVPIDAGENFMFDLDVPTYQLLTDRVRSGLGVLALIVLHETVGSWLEMDAHTTTLAHCAYYLPLHGLPPTTNTATIRLAVPKANVLNQEAMRMLMKTSRARFAAL